MLIGVLRKLLKAEETRVCVGGYAGCGNLGDDAILEGYLQRRREKGETGEVIALTGRPRADSRRFFVRCYQRKNPVAVICALLRSGEFLCGGGSLLQNATGNRSLFYYLTLIRTAKRCGCRVSLLAAGIGPVHGEKQRRQMRDVLNRCDRVEVRDPDSMRFLLCIGVRRELLTVVQDPAAFLPIPPPTRRIFLLTECGIPIGTPYFCAALRTPEDAGTLTRLAAAFRLVAEKHALVPVFFVMDRERDRSATAAVCRAIGGKTVRIREPADVPAILSGCRFLVSMRLHALFFADRCGVPAVALSAGEEEPKLASFCRETGVPLFPTCVSVPALTTELERTGVL